jgi:hypothetical protein
MLGTSRAEDRGMRTHSTIVLLGLASALTFACGGAISRDVDDGASSVAATDAGHAGDDGGAVKKDGGTQGCKGPAPDCGPLCGGSYDAVCSGGQWVCPDFGDDVGCFDAGGGDDASDANEPDANDGKLTCGNLTCDPTTSFCKIGEGGIPDPDGGTNIWYSCESIPVQCQATPTCGCLDQGCNCTQHGSEFTVTCEYP